MNQVRHPAPPPLASQVQAAMRVYGPLLPKAVMDLIQQLATTVDRHEAELKTLRENRQ